MKDLFERIEYWPIDITGKKIPIRDSSHVRALAAQPTLSYEREVELTSAIIAFLKRHPSPLGQALLDNVREPWKAWDARQFENLVAQFGGSEEQVAGFLAIAHNAAHDGSVKYDKHVSFPGSRVRERGPLQFRRVRGPERGVPLVG